MVVVWHYTLKFWKFRNNFSSLTLFFFERIYLKCSSALSLPSFSLNSVLYICYFLLDKHILLPVYLYLLLQIESNVVNCRKLENKMYGEKNKNTYKSYYQGSSTTVSILLYIFVFFLFFVCGYVCMYVYVNMPVYFLKLHLIFKRK